MSDSSGDLVLRVKADKTGITEVKSLIRQLEAVAAGSSKNVVANAAKRAAGGTRKYTKSVRAGASASREFTGAVRGVSGALGGLWLTYTSILPTIAAFGAAISLRKAITEGAEFTFQLRAIQGISQATTKTVDAAGDAILSLGTRSLQGPIELVKGFRILTQAGFSVKEAMSALPAVAGLAIIGQLSLEKATSITSAALHQFNLDTSRTSEVVDALAKAAAVSATNVEQVGTAMSYVGGMAAVLGVSLEDVNALLAVLASRGVVGSKAGTSLQRALINLTAGTPKTTKALSELGVKVFDTHEKFKGAIPVVQMLAKALSGFTKKAQVSFLRDIFGARGMKAGAALMAEASGKLTEFQRKITEASEGIGFANEQLIIMSQSAEGQGKRAFNTFTASLISGAKDSEDAMMGVAEAAREMFKSEGFKHGVKAAIEGMANFTKSLIDHRDTILLVAKAYLVLQGVGMARSLLGSGAFAAAGAGLMAFNERLVLTTKILQGVGVKAAALKAPFFIMRRGIRAAKLALASLGTFLISNPLGWLVLTAAIGGAAYALYKFATRVKEFKAEGVPDLSILSSQVKEIAQAKLNTTIDKLNELRGITKEQAAIGLQRGLVRQATAGRSEAEDQLAMAQGAVDKARADLAKVKKERRDQGPYSGGVFREQAARSALTAANNALGQSLANAVAWRKRELAVTKDLTAAEKLLKKNKEATAAIEFIQKGAAERVAGTKSRILATEISIKDVVKKASELERKENKDFRVQQQLLSARRRLIGEREFTKESEALTQQHTDRLLSIYGDYYAKGKAIRAIGASQQKQQQQALNKFMIKAVEVGEEQRLQSLLGYYSRLTATVKKTESATKTNVKGIASATGRTNVAESANMFGQTDPLAKYAAERLKVEVDYNTQVTEITKQRIQAGKLQGADKALFLQKLREQEISNVKLHQQRLTANTAEEANERKKIKTAEARSLISSTSQTFGAIADLIGSSSKKSFERAKKYRIAAATMAAIGGAAGAFADTPGNTFVRIVAGVAALAVGIARVQQIRKTQYQGQAHDGLPTVPSTGTYILERGERVVKQEDNKKLQRFLDDNTTTTASASGRGVGVTQVSININTIDSRGVEQFFQQNEGLVQRLVQNGYDQRLVTGGPLR